MAVHFLDDETGEISDVWIDTGEQHQSPRRAARPAAPVPEKRERSRNPIMPVVVVLVAIAAFLVGGGVGMSFAQGEIHDLKMQLDYPDVP